MTVQKTIRLSQDRLEMYFNKHIVESLELKAGEEVQVSVPDKGHIVLKINKSLQVGCVRNQTPHLMS